MSDSIEESPDAVNSSDGGSSKRLTGAEAAALAGHISGLAAAALPLQAGLRSMAEEIPSSGLRDALLDLAVRLDRGEPLESALVQMSPAMPDHMRSLVRAGVQTGRLGEILAQYVRYHSLATQMHRKTVSSMFYPFVLIIVFFCILSFMMVLIVPKFKKIFMDFGVELPQVTDLLLAVSDLCVEFWQFWFVLILAGPILFWVWARFFLRSPTRQRLLYLVPLMGPLWRWTGLAQFARILAMLVESELPLPVALRLAGDGVGDAEIADAASHVAKDIEAGQSLAESSARRSRFPAGLAQSLQWSEGTQSLAESIRSAAEMSEGQAMIHAEFVLRAAPPLTMIFILVLLGFTVIGLFMPLIKLITELSG